ncbi:MAG TPA: gluconate 2-dehydrogenase subunit 3 family protein, partial [Acidimicrobiia bacterium]|nr:gluconate 2-dehydrogenase subunit 3 family protein [Acidimicrobiia bacterium]
MELRFLTATEHACVAAAADRLIPPHAGHPGGAALGVADYVDTLLGAFTFDPPRIFAGGPFSGRFGGDAQFAQFHELAPLEELAWRMRIEGSRGDPAREFNGPVRGWQEIYRDGLTALGADFAQLDGAQQDERLAAAPELRVLLAEHA